MLPNIHIKLRKDKVKDNKQAIVLQVYYNKKQKQVFTGLYIEEKYFDNGKILSSAPNYSWYRQMIKNKINELEASFLKQSIEKGNIDLTPSKTNLTRQSFFEYAYKMYRGMSNRNSDTYIIRSIQAIKDFEEWAGSLSFSDITPQLLKDYESALFKKPLKRNTINRIYKRIKQVFTSANNENITDHNPFKIFKPVTYKQPQRDYLTIDEVHMVEAAEVPEEIEHIKNYFLLACYTGLRFLDIQKFNPAKSIIRNKGTDRIIIGTTKTGEIVSIKVSENIRRFVNKIDKPLPSNVHTNRMLKIIGQLAGIARPINFHMSRHAAAVNMASAGIPIEAVAKILGHSSIRTTAIYYKITDTKMDDLMDQFDKFIEGKKS